MSSCNRPVTPLLATDVVVRVIDPISGRSGGIVLIERRNPPVGLALPGGFVDVGETVETAARREMREEIGLDVRLDGLLGVYSDPARDARGHTVSVVYTGTASGHPVAGDDARRANVYPPDALPLDRLVFDHRRILEDYLANAGRNGPG